MFVFGVDADEITQLRKERKNFKTDPRCAPARPPGWRAWPWALGVAVRVARPQRALGRSLMATPCLCLIAASARNSLVLRRAWAAPCRRLMLPMLAAAWC